MRFTEDDFPVVVLRDVIFTRKGAAIGQCRSPQMAAEIAKRLNRDNQAYPETDGPRGGELPLPEIIVDGRAVPNPAFKERE